MTKLLVHQLALALPHTRHVYFNLYMDNYFPSIALFERLRDLGIGVCGTVRVRKTAFPPHLHDNRSCIPGNTLSRGPAGSTGKVLAVQWQDQGVVHLLTTIQSLEERTTVLPEKPHQSSSNGPAIRQAFGAMERADVPIPVITNDYNRYKVGVDVADQYRSYYVTQLKCLRNWPPILYWLLDTTAINAYLLSQ